MQTSTLEINTNIPNSADIRIRYSLFINDRIENFSLLIKAENMPWKNEFEVGTTWGFEIFPRKGFDFIQWSNNVKSNVTAMKMIKPNDMKLEAQLEQVCMYEDNINENKLTLSDSDIDNLKWFINNTIIPMRKISES